MAILKVLPTDYTYDQTRCIRVYKTWYKQGETNIYCYDLSAATDRLPRLLQGGILKIIGLSEQGVIE